MLKKTVNQRAGRTGCNHSSTSIIERATKNPRQICASLLLLCNLAYGRNEKETYCLLAETWTDGWNNALRTRRGDYLRSRPSFSLSRLTNPIASISRATLYETNCSGSAFFAAVTVVESSV